MMGDGWHGGNPTRTTLASEPEYMAATATQLVHFSHRT